MSTRADLATAEGTIPESADAPARVREEARARLNLVDLHDGRRAWIAALILLALALAMRLWNLGGIDELIFDETYYVKDGYTVATTGVERDWITEPDPDPAFEAGDVDSYLDRGAYVVHPPVGKWIIGAPMALFGADSPWMWRISVALLGSLSVLMLARIGRRLFRSTSVGLMAGLLLAVDGQHLVASRTSLLDLPLMFFVLAAFGALLIDRDQHRERLATSFARAGAPQAARWYARVRWWRIAAGVLLGLACGVKWSGLYFLAVFGITTVLWDWWARRRLGDPAWLRRGFTLDAVPAFFAMVGTALLTYIAGWSGWFASSDGYFRTWAADNGHTAGGPVVQALRSLWHYHQDAYTFHTGLDAEHTYASSPVGWLLQIRPVNYHYDALTYGQAGCEVERCSTQVLALGNPALWWLGCVAILVTVVVGVWKRDGRAWAALSGIIAGYLPWFAYLDRTVFSFYTVVFVPWVALCLAFALGILAGQVRVRGGKDSLADPLPRLDVDHRLVGTAAAGALLVVIVLVAAFFWPIWTGETIELRQWQWRMWLPSWR